MILTSINQSGDFLACFLAPPKSADYSDLANKYGKRKNPRKSLPVFLRKGGNLAHVGESLELIDASELEPGATFKHGPSPSMTFRVRAHRAPILRAAIEHHRTNTTASGIPSAVGVVCIGGGGKDVAPHERPLALLLETESGGGAGARRLFRELADFVRA